MKLTLSKKIFKVLMLLSLVIMSLEILSKKSYASDKINTENSLVESNLNECISLLESCTTDNELLLKENNELKEQLQSTLKELKQEKEKRLAILQETEKLTAAIKHPWTIDLYGSIGFNYQNTFLFAGGLGINFSFSHFVIGTQFYYINGYAMFINFGYRF